MTADAYLGRLGLRLLAAQRIQQRLLDISYAILSGLRPAFPAFEPLPKTAPQLLQAEDEQADPAGSHALPCREPRLEEGVHGVAHTHTIQLKQHCTGAGPFAQTVEQCKLYKAR